MICLKELNQYVKYLPMTHRFFQLLRKHSQNNLNSDLKKVTEWAHQWKMLFNPDPRKQAMEVYFSRKLNQNSPLPLDFNDNKVQTVEVHNPLGLSLDKKLDFNIRIKNKINKYNKMIGIRKRLPLSFSRGSLLTIYKSFVCPHYADIIYDKLKDILKNQSAKPKFFSDHFFLIALKYGMVLTYKIYTHIKNSRARYRHLLSNSIFSVHGVYGVKHLSRLRLDFSHLNEPKVRHGFENGTNCMCNCGSAKETTLHFLLQCQQYQTD